MPLVDPEELFQQAHALIGPVPPPYPPQMNLRRAISAAYYGLFHTVVRAAADMVAGEGNRSTERYDWVYRSVQHSRLREVCSGARTKWGDDFGKFGEAVIQLQQAREDADYAQNAAYRRLVEATAELNVQPTTLAGVAALLRYIAESYDGSDDEGGWTAILFAEDDEDSEREPIVDNEKLLQEILETIAEAVQSI